MARKKRKLHGREINTLLYTCSARGTKNHQGEGPQREARVVVGYQLMIWLMCIHRPHSIKARDERLHFKMVYPTVNGKANTAVLCVTHAQITLRRKQEHTANEAQTEISH